MGSKDTKSSDSLEARAAIASTLPTFSSHEEAVAYVVTNLSPGLARTWAEPMLRSATELFWRTYATNPVYTEPDGSYSYHCNVLAFCIHAIRRIDTPEQASAWMTRCVL